MAVKKLIKMFSDALDEFGYWNHGSRCAALLLAASEEGVAAGLSREEFMSAVKEALLVVRPYPPFKADLEPIRPTQPRTKPSEKRETTEPSCLDLSRLVDACSLDVRTILMAYRHPGQVNAGVLFKVHAAAEKLGLPIPGGPANSKEKRKKKGTTKCSNQD